MTLSIDDFEVARDLIWRYNLLAKILGFMSHNPDDYTGITVALHRKVGGQPIQYTFTLPGEIGHLLSEIIMTADLTADKHAATLKSLGVSVDSPDPPPAETVTDSDLQPSADLFELSDYDEDQMIVTFAPEFNIDPDDTNR